MTLNALNRAFGNDWFAEFMKQEPGAVDVDPESGKTFPAENSVAAWARQRNNIAHIIDLKRFYAPMGNVFSCFCSWYWKPMDLTPSAQSPFPDVRALALHPALQSSQAAPLQQAAVASGTLGNNLSGGIAGLAACRIVACHHCRKAAHIGRTSAEAAEIAIVTGTSHL